MDIEIVIKVVIIVGFMAFLIYRGGERKKYVSRSKIDECIDVLNKKLKHPRAKYEVDEILVKRLSEDLYDEKTLQAIAYDIVATLVHECMHLYLNTIGLRYEDRNMNEYLTDVATVYMGFYDVIEQGYFRQGYLTTNDLKRVQKRLKSQGDSNVVSFRR